MLFTLPDLPYPFDALEPYIDAKTMEIHHDKHHGAPVSIAFSRWSASILPLQGRGKKRIFRPSSFSRSRLFVS